MYSVTRLLDIVSSCGPGVFRRTPVVDRDHHGGKTVGEVAAQSVMAVQITEHETAAVCVHEDRQGTGLVRPVDPNRNDAAGSGDGLVPDLGNGFGLGRWHESRGD